jgi:hypothetical protein
VFVVGRHQLEAAQVGRRIAQGRLQVAGDAFGCRHKGRGNAPLSQERSEVGALAQRFGNEVHGSGVLDRIVLRPLVRCRLGESLRLAARVIGATRWRRLGSPAAKKQLRLTPDRAAG